MFRRVEHKKKVMTTKKLKARYDEAIFKVDYNPGSVVVSSTVGRVGLLAPSQQTEAERLPGKGFKIQ